MPPWNLSAHYELDPRTYEQGGKCAPVPAGYWVNITALAAAYNWEAYPRFPIGAPIMLAAASPNSRSPTA